MRFLCVQTGARRGYAVPSALHRAGMLERLYTDLAGNLGVGRLLALGAGLPLPGRPLERLAKRRLPEELLPLTTDFPLPALRHQLAEACGSRRPEAVFRRALRHGERLGAAMVKRGFGEATHVFAMLSEGGPLLAEAKRSGLGVVTEVYILLATERLLADEQRAFPEWEPAAPDYAALRRRHHPDDSYPALADLCLCPSEAVRDDLVAHWGVPAERTALVPYGMDPRWLELDPEPERGRILFVGTADLRKGIHYLAFAAERLRASGFGGEIRVAGHASEAVRRQPACRHLTFLGRIPRDRIHEEFRRADLFVLPSLAEGSAEVTYEALAAGVPQIVTRAAGSVARDGVEGLLVPERDPEALAAAIERLVEDRPRRARLAEASRTRAREFTWERYGERLLGVLKDQRKLSR